MRLLILISLFFLSVNSFADNEKLIDKIIACESSGHNLDKHGRFNCNYMDTGTLGPSCGIAQFRRATFYEFAAAAKDWPFGKPKWTSKEQQIWLLKWALRHGHANRWACYRKVK